MPDNAAELGHAAELAVFARKSLSLAAATDAGLPGRFESFHLGELRIGIATAEHYGFLNTIEGVNEKSVEVLPEALERFPDPRQVTVVATSPSLSLINRLLSKGYEQVPVRPIAYLSTQTPAKPRALNGWDIRGASTSTIGGQQFSELLTAGYSASDEVSALIRAEHALPAVRGFVASRDGQALAAAAMSLHPTGAVLGGASTLHAARGTGAQAALVAYRFRLAKTLNSPLATATAAPGTPSVRNLTRLGFTIIERTAWSHRFRRHTGKRT